MTMIIAEIGQNYNGSLGDAFRLIKLAKDAGADVAKFQIFDPLKIFTEEGNPWWEYNLANELTHEDVVKIFEECKKNEIEFMASVFDVERSEWLLDLNVNRIKIASRSIKDSDLVEKAIRSGKEIVISLGQWTEKGLPYSPQDNVKYLHCISKYPTELSELNLRNVDFSFLDGFSDHSIGVTAALFAMSNGAKIIEKHFTDDKMKFGPDHAGSATPNEFKVLCEFRDQLKVLS